MTKVIREHRVFGVSICVKAESEQAARDRVLSGKKSSHYVWEITETFPGFWSAYVAKLEDAAALND